MASQDFKVEVSEEWKSLPDGCKRFTQNDEGRAFLGEAALVGDLADKTGEKIVAGVPYVLDTSKKYHIRTVGSTCSFGIVTE